MGKFRRWRGRFVVERHSRLVYDFSVDDRSQRNFAIRQQIQGKRLFKRTLHNQHYEFERDCLDTDL